ITRASRDRQHPPCTSELSFLVTNAFMQHPVGHATDANGADLPRSSPFLRVESVSSAVSVTSEPITERRRCVVATIATVALWARRHHDLCSPWSTAGREPTTRQALRRLRLLLSTRSPRPGLS